MAFISEVSLLGGGGVSNGEFVEIVLGPNDDPADFVVSVYDENGTLYPGVGIPGGEATLSSYVGVPDPDNSDFTVYTIPVGLRNGASNSTEGSAIALTDISAGGQVVDFYSAERLAPITAVDGAAATATSEAILDHTILNNNTSFQWDIYGNQTIGPITNSDAVLCIAADAMVSTSTGLSKAQDLNVGDLVWTSDRGHQPIRWIGKETVSTAEMRRSPNKTPVRISSGSLGDRVPLEDLLLSRQHRVVASSPIAERMFDCAEILIAATRLTELPGIDDVRKLTTVTYFHLLFDHHEIIRVNCALVESLLVTSRSAGLVSLPAEFADIQHEHARPIAEGSKAKTFIQRSLKNGKPIFASAAMATAETSQA